MVAAVIVVTMSPGLLHSTVMSTSTSTVGVAPSDCESHFNSEVKKFHDAVVAEFNMSHQEHHDTHGADHKGKAARGSLCSEKAGLWGGKVNDEARVWGHVFFFFSCFSHAKQLFETKVSQTKTNSQSTPRWV